MKKCKTAVCMMILILSISSQGQTQINMEDQKDTLSYIQESVISDDGVSYGYIKMGRGPGIVILHGTNESAMSHIELAEILADSFTVYLPDRRGRGMTFYHTNNYSIQKDIDDLIALINKTNTKYVFAISSGAVIALKAVLQTNQIERIALWEPPLGLEMSKVQKGLIRYDREISQNKIASAMVTAMKTSKMGPKLFNIMPRFLLKSFTRKIMKKQDAAAKSEEVTLSELAPTIHHDFEIIIESIGKMDQFKDINKPTLLLHGDKSAKHLINSTDKLEAIIPFSKKTTLQGLDHGGTGNSEWGGKPALVAQELFKFFSQ